MEKIYHYTKGYNLPGIIQSGFIKREGFAGRQSKSAKQFLKKTKIERQVWLTAETEMPFSAMPSIEYIPGVNEFLHFQKAADRGYAQWAHLAGGVYRFVFDKKAIGASSYMTGEVRKKLERLKLVKIFESIAHEGGDDITKWYHLNRPIKILGDEEVEMWSEQAGWNKVSMAILIMLFA